MRKYDISKKEYRSSPRSAAANLFPPISDQNSNSYFHSASNLQVPGAYRVKNHQNLNIRKPTCQHAVLPCLSILMNLDKLYVLLIPQIRLMFIPSGDQGGAGPVSTTFPPFTNHWPCPRSPV